MRFFLFALGAMMLSLLNVKGAERIDSRTVGYFDVNKYMGRWYEIARLNHPFEQGLVGVMATYSKMDDGQVKILNSGYDTNRGGKFRTIEGRARFLDRENPGLLRATFFLVATSNYYILELDCVNYSYALVGNGNPDHLWILSRTPQLPHEVLNHLLERAKARGYDLSEIVFVDQQHNIKRPDVAQKN